MEASKFRYDPQHVYQWATADLERDEALSREDGSSGLQVPSTRRDPRAQSSQFNQLVVSTSHPFPGHTLHSATPDNLGIYQAEQRNFTTSADMNAYNDYAYSRFGSPSPSRTITNAPPPTDSDMHEQFLPHLQAPPSGAEYEASVSHHPGDCTQYRQYLTPSRSTALQQRAGPSAPGPTRTMTWRARAKPYEGKAEAAELLRLHSPLGLSLDKRKHALRQQFNKSQSSTNSPISPLPSTSASYTAIGTAPYLSETRHQPLPDQPSAHLSADSNNVTSFNENSIHHTTPSAPSTFDESSYSQGFVTQGFVRGWRDVHAQHSHPQPSNVAPSNDSSPPSEKLAPSQANNAVHLSPVSSAPPPPPSNTVGTVFIHSNLTNQEPNATNTVNDHPEHLHFFPLQTEDHRQLRVSMHTVLTSEWRLRNELEPTSQDILQFSTRVPSGGAEGDDGGTAKYRCLLYHNGDRCTRSWARAERMLAHLRGAIDLRPFACEGDGDVCNCGMRFFAEDTLQQHRKNTKAVECQYCGAAVTPRNIKRHRRNNCPKSPERPPD